MVEVVERIEVRESPVELDELGQVLLKARDIIRTNGWCQNAYMDYDNPDDWVEMKKAPRVCLLGALHIAAGSIAPDDEGVDVTEHVKRMRLGVPALEWNDTTDRTQQEVEERLERAAYNL